MCLLLQTHDKGTRTHSHISSRDELVLVSVFHCIFLHVLFYHHSHHLCWAYNVRQFAQFTMSRYIRTRNVIQQIRICFWSRFFRFWKWGDADATKSIEWRTRIIQFFFLSFFFQTSATNNNDGRDDDDNAASEKKNRGMKGTTKTMHKDNKKWASPP